MQQIGVVSRLRRYPVKSMAGEDLERVFVAYSGLTGDRIYALVGLSEKKSFPWLSARQRPGLLLYKPRFVQPLCPESPYPNMENLAVTVRLPHGLEGSLTDPRVLEALRKDLQCDFQLRFSERGMQDSRPLSLMGEATIAALSRETGQPLDPRRFRANLYVRWLSEEPFFEDALVGRQLQIGEKLTLLISKKDPRCKVIGLDPDTAESQPAILETVVRAHDGCAGVYAVVLREGIIETGAPIYAT